MKKVLLLALVAAGVLAWRRRASDKAERDLWAEATDTIR
ncbi:DLW-39 family protein [Kineococcus sp. NUM-3379]